MITWHRAVFGPRVIVWGYCMQSGCVLWGVYVCVSVSVCFRTAGVGSIQRGVSELGSGLWRMCPAHAGRPGTLLYPLPSRLTEPAGIWVAVNLLVTRPVTSKYKHMIKLNVYAQYKLSPSYSIKDVPFSLFGLKDCQLPFCVTIPIHSALHRWG